MTEMIEADLDYIQGLVKELPRLGLNIDQINEQGIFMLTDILRDLAIANGAEFVVEHLTAALKIFTRHYDRYEEYHKIFKDYSEIEAL